MQEEFGLHAPAVEDARHGHQRPKIEEYGDTVFAVLHRVECAGELEIARGRHLRRTQLRAVGAQPNQQGFLGVRERCEREPEHLSQGAGFVLYALMDAVVDRYFPMIGIETELEAIEGHIFQARRAATSSGCTN